LLSFGLTGKKWQGTGKSAKAQGTGHKKLASVDHVICPKEVLHQRCRGAMRILSTAWLCGNNMRDLGLSSIKMLQRGTPGLIIFVAW
jgi:hypothetical protein